MNKRPRILVTGLGGQVGWELQRTLATLGEVTLVGLPQFDMSQPESLREPVRALKPDWIVNSAAYTAVDRAESEEALAAAINGTSAGVLAEEAARLGARMLHFSTDYVFPGDRPEPYTETDAPGPLSAYGRTKLLGEELVLKADPSAAILRTAWVYGIRGSNFLLTMLRLANERPALRVVADQYGSPTWSRMLAETVAMLIARELGGAAPVSGVFHTTSSGYTTWHRFAERIIEWGAERGLCKRIPVEPIGTADYPTPAKRPAYSMLDGSRLLQATGIALPDWELSLALCLDDLKR